MSEIVKIFSWEHKKTSKQGSPSERENESNNVSMRSASPQTPPLQPLPRTHSKNNMNERLKRRRSFVGAVNPPYPVNPPRPMYTMNPSSPGSFYNYPIYPTYPTYNPYPQQQELLYTTPYPAQDLYYPYTPPYPPTQLPLPSLHTSVELQRERLESFHHQHEYQLPQVRLCIILYYILIYLI